LKNFRFLFFLYYYPPTPGTAARRNFGISSFISHLVSSSFIFTSTKVPSAKPSEGHVTIETLPTFDYRYFLRHRTKDGALPEHKKKSKSAQFMIRLINSYPINIIAGEGGLIYLLYAIRKGGSIIRKEKITHLYSSYRPFTDHYVAYWLKRNHPHLVWIADFRDLMIDTHYHHILFPDKHHALYKWIFSKAELLTTVSDGLAQHLRTYNPNVLTLRNGIQNEFAIPKSVHTSLFSIVYTGSMFLDKRNAEPLFQALKELIEEGKIERTNLQLIYAGKDGLLWNHLASKYNFEPLLTDMGIITGEAATAIQMKACINVLLTISSDTLQGVLTGKMIEYIEAGSPVLAIIVNQNDPEIQLILRELEIGDSFSDQPSDLNDIKDFILAKYLEWKQTGMNSKPVNSDVVRMKYMQESTMKPLLEALTNKEQC
jgi:hypothetical protein